MGCGVQVLKYLTFIFNLVFAICGVALVIYGIVLKTNHKENPTTGLIVIGCVIFVISFFGFCGAIRENTCMLITFSVILILLLIIQVAIAIVSIVTINNVGKDTLCKDELASFFSTYDKKGEESEFYNFQRENQCCGYNGPSDFNRDWTNGNLPPSCCKGDKEICSIIDAEYHGMSCLEYCEFLVTVGGTLAAVPLIIIGVIELLGISFAISLTCAFRNSIRKTTFA